MIVERSGDHCHLTEETFYRIFGGPPTIDRRLKNEKYFVYKEKLDITAFGKITILGPFRKHNQLEVALSTAFSRRVPLPKAGQSGDTRYLQTFHNVRGVTVDNRLTTEDLTFDFIYIQSTPHAHIPSETKYFKRGSILLGDVEIKNCPIYFDPTITVESIHLDNDWYNAVRVQEGTVRVRSETR